VTHDLNFILQISSNSATFIQLPVYVIMIMVLFICSIISKIVEVAYLLKIFSPITIINFTNSLPQETTFYFIFLKMKTVNLMRSYLVCDFIQFFTNGLIFTKFGMNVVLLEDTPNHVIFRFVQSVITIWWMHEPML